MRLDPKIWYLFGIAARNLVIPAGEDPATLHCPFSVKPGGRIRKGDPRCQSSTGTVLAAAASWDPSREPRPGGRALTAGEGSATVDGARDRGLRRFRDDRRATRGGRWVEISRGCLPPPAKGHLLWADDRFGSQTGDPGSGPRGPRLPFPPPIPEPLSPGKRPQRRSSPRMLVPRPPPVRRPTTKNGCGPGCRGARQLCVRGHRLRHSEDCREAPALGSPRPGLAAF